MYISRKKGLKFPRVPAPVLERSPPTQVLSSRLGLARQPTLPHLRPANWGGALKAPQTSRPRSGVSRTGSRPPPRQPLPQGLLGGSSRAPGRPSAAPAPGAATQPSPGPGPSGPGSRPAAAEEPRSPVLVVLVEVLVGVVDLLVGHPEEGGQRAAGGAGLEPRKTRALRDKATACLWPTDHRSNDPGLNPTASH